MISEFIGKNMMLFKEVELYLEEGLYRIYGEHADDSRLRTMGRNEVGKTSLLLSMAWVLCGDFALPSGHNIKRDFKSSTTTSGLITIRNIKGVEYTLERIKRQKDPLIIKQGGRSLTETEFLKEIGCPSMSALVRAIYFNVNDAGLLRITQPAMRMKIFEDLIDVSDLDSKQLELKDQLQTVRSRLSANRTRISVLETEKNTAFTFNTKTVIEAENYLKTADNSVNQLQAEVAAKLPNLQAEIDALQNNKRALVEFKDNLIKQISIQEATLNDITVKLANISGVTACPTCLRDFSDPVDLQRAIDSFRLQSNTALTKVGKLRNQLLATDVQYTAIIRKEAELNNTVKVLNSSLDELRVETERKKKAAKVLIAQFKESQAANTEELSRLKLETEGLSAQEMQLDYESSKGIYAKKMIRITESLKAIDMEVNRLLKPLGLSLQVATREAGTKIVLDIIPGHSASDKEVSASHSGDAAFDIYQIALAKAMTTVLLPDFKLDFMLMNEPLRSMSATLAITVTEWIRDLYTTVVMVTTGAEGEIKVTRHFDHSTVEQL